MRHGLIDVLADVLATLAVRGDASPASNVEANRALTEVDEVRLQVILLLDSLVSGRHLLPIPAIRTRLIPMNRRTRSCVGSCFQYSPDAC